MRIKYKERTKENPAGCMDVCVVLCMMYSKEKRQKPGQSGQRNTKREQKKSRRGLGCLCLPNVLCFRAEVSAMDRSLVHWSPTDCDVPLYAI
jgi:hypothetical protein